MRKPTFETFYTLHLDRVYRFLYFRVGMRRELAEDLTSEVFTKALAHYDRYDPTQSQSAWIMTIARNHLFNYFRDRKEEVDLEEVAFRIPDERAPGPDLIDHERLLAALCQLSPEERQLVEMKHLEGYPHQEIAEALGKSPGAVRVELHRAMNKLKSLFKDWYAPIPPKTTPQREQA